MTKRKKKTISNIILIILLLVAAFCAFMIAKYFIQGWNAQKDIKTLEDEKKTVGISRLKEKNTDTWGWLRVEGTGISCPVMYTPKEPQKYLRKNFKKEYSLRGLPFLDGNTEPDISRNWIIYGHHLQDGSMFSSLLKYSKDEEYAVNHRNISIEYMKGTLNAKVFAFGEFNNDSELFALQNVTTREEYFKLIGLITDNDKCTMLKSPDMGSQIITLATCKDALAAEKGKFVVFAYSAK